jgi:hypothetical protein
VAEELKGKLGIEPTARAEELLVADFCRIVEKGARAFSTSTQTCWRCSQFVAFDARHDIGGLH